MSDIPEGLVVKGLKTYFHTREGTVKAVDGVDLVVAPGKILGLVGESGSGKSVTGLSIMRLVDSPGQILEGRIWLNQVDLLALPQKKMRKMRGAKIAMIFQDAMATLNPVLRIDTQMMESIFAHRKVSERKARKIAIDSLSQVGISSPEERLRTYPHQYSGGMRQRVVIAISMLNHPEFIIADEPTTALDVTIQSQIIYETKKLCREKQTGLIWITHDLTVIAGLADTVAVMYAGKIIEKGGVNEILDQPFHPYTKGLIGSVPSKNRRGKRLFQIPGMAPSLSNLPPGCAFQPRCQYSREICGQTPPLKVYACEREVRCFFPLER
jgi:peptide/nickel transport system ATP-binding protein